MQPDTLDWFSHPHSSALLIYLLGGWSIFAVYHIILYLRNKNTLYLLYGLYLVAIIGYQIKFLRPSYFPYSGAAISFIKDIPEIFAELSYLIYFVFAFKFLNIKKDFPKWYKLISRALVLIAIFTLVSFVLNLVTNDKVLAMRLYHFFVIYILILSVITYVMFFRSRHPLRFYIIIGSLLLLIFSVISLILTIQDIALNQDPQYAYLWLYTGYLLETILFALGLGHLQYFNEREKIEAQNNLIHQMEQNKQLQQQVERDLRQNVTALTKKAEKDEIEHIKMRYEQQLSELKLTVLRSQMNPHFIFNSLNSIKRYIIENEQENAVYYLNKFSKLIRKILSASMEGDISLAEELETAELYVNIENIRFNDTINFKKDIDNSLNLDTIKIPALILQPFLENAIWHGLALVKGDKLLTLSVHRKSEDYIKITIDDNGIGRKRSAELKKKKLHKRDSLGIVLTKERLEKFTRDMKNVYRLTFIDFEEDGQPKGTKVTIEMPLR